MKAQFIVRAQVPEPDRAAFDTWYESEHLPDAMSAFGCVQATRGWSELEPGVHIATYAFADLDTARALLAEDASTAIRKMIAEFDRVWEGRVTRTRELVAIRQVIEG